MYNSTYSLSFVFSANTINWAWGLNGYNVESIGSLRPTGADANTQQVTANLFQHAVEIPNPLTYQIVNVNFSLPLHFTSSGNAPSIIASNDTWTVTKYTGSRPPNTAPFRMPYHGKSGFASDVWYTIDSAQGNGRLSLTNSSSNSTVIVVSSPSGLLQYWRFIPYTKPISFSLSGYQYSVFLIQSVANNQLLINSGYSVIVIGDETGWGEDENNTQKMWVLNLGVNTYQSYQHSYQR